LGVDEGAALPSQSWFPNFTTTEATGHDINQHTSSEANAVEKQMSKQSFRSFYAARNVTGSTQARHGSSQKESPAQRVHDAPASFPRSYYVARNVAEGDAGLGRNPQEESASERVHDASAPGA